MDTTRAVQALGVAFQARQARRARLVANDVQRLWAQLDPQDLTGSWVAAVGPRIVRSVTAGQVSSAGAADGYVGEVVAAEGADPDRAGRVRAAAFAGVAADGRALDSLLYLPVITSKEAVAAGLPVDEALLRGLFQMVMLASSEVADAGRSAVGAAIVADRTTTGYVRVLSPPSCARCVILAGKVYHTATAFQRHPHCDCVHLPTVYGFRPHTSDPDAYFQSLSAAEQDRAFGKAGAQAIRDGADMGQVVNARRGMYALGDRYGLKATREGMTKRGLARQRLRALEGAGRARGTVRLMPESIYRIAADRDEAIRLLYRYGYLY